jgi:hypothetical protein
VIVLQVIVSCCHFNGPGNIEQLGIHINTLTIIKALISGNWYD